MSFGDHLDELRRRCLWALVVPVPLAIVAFMFAGSIRAVLCEPAFRAQRANGLPAQLQVLSPIETIVADMHLALVMALVLSAPWILWQVWKFVEPGLYASEKRFVRMLVPMSAVLTVAGLSLLYFAMLPLMLRFLVSFGGSAPTELDAAPAAAVTTNGAATTQADDVFAELPILAVPPAHPRPGQIWLTPERELRVAMPGATDGKVELLALPLKRPSTLDQQFRLREYLDFVLMLLLATAIAFQLPLVMLLLGWIGVVDAAWLRRFRRHAFFVCVIIAALITPTVDPVSLALMTLPLYALFELGVLLLIVAPPRAVAEGSVWRRIRQLVLGHGRVSS